MTNARRERGGAAKHKAQGNKRSLPVPPSPSFALDVRNTAEFSQRNQPEGYGYLPSSNSDLVLSGISDLAIETSPRSLKDPRSDTDHPEKRVERRFSSPSPSDLNSDDEIIIFSGRASRNLENHGLAVDANLSKPKAEKYSKILARSMLSRNMSGMDGQAASCKDSRSLKGRKVSRDKRSQRQAGRKEDLEEDEENAIIADYISNMQSTDGSNDPVIVQQFRHRDLALDRCGESFQGLHADENVYQEEIRDPNDWDSADLRDFEDFSSSSEPMSATPLVLRKRLRNSEAQYLVVASGESVDEARWLNRNLLTAPRASEMIDIFEEDQSKVRHFATDSVLSEGSSTRDTLENEKDLEERSKIRVSDEQIARLLSKQAELGLIGDDLVLYDGHAFEETSEDNVPAIGFAAASPRTSIPSRNSKKQSRTQSPLALSTQNGALDPYDGFDVMDYERPSLRKKAKGGLPSEHMLELSDSDLQQSVIAAWKSDRIKKKHRKQEREIQRTQGLLGKKGKRENPKKSGGDMEMGDIVREVKGFLQASTASLPLPPMHPRERKLIHFVAHKSGLTSKSRGAGAARFPVLYRTSRTKTLTPSLDAEITALLTPKYFLPRPDKLRWRGIPASRNNTTGMAAAASYRDGEIVGIGAPEIGTENRGRTMLEKMGWSTGNSLGAGNNKGIAQPIEQIVKTSKAGLG